MKPLNNYIYEMSNKHYNADEYKKDTRHNDLKDIAQAYIDAIGGYSHTPKKIVFCVIARIEINKLKELVREIDPNAFISVENVHEVEGKRFKKSTKTF